MSKFQTVVAVAFFIFVVPSTEAANIPDLKLCQLYEMRGQLSNDLRKEAILSTTGESGLKIDLVIEPSEDISLDLISLKGKFVVVKAFAKKKLSSRKYAARVSHIQLGKPPGLGEGRGNFKARKLDEKLLEPCRG